jgi:hypothetical protein
MKMGRHYVVDVIKQWRIGNSYLESRKTFQYYTFFRREIGRMNTYVGHGNLTNSHELGVFGRDPIRMFDYCGDIGIKLTRQCSGCVVYLRDDLELPNCPWCGAIQVIRVFHEDLQKYSDLKRKVSPVSGPAMFG